MHMITMRLDKNESDLLSPPDISAQRQLRHPLSPQYKACESHTAYADKSKSTDIINYEYQIFIFVFRYKYFIYV